MTKRIFSFFLAAAMLLTMLPMTGFVAKAAPASENILDDITWVAGTNLKTSYWYDATRAPYAVGSNGSNRWTWHSTSYAQNGGKAWIALDLGQAYDIDGFSWLSSNGMSHFKDCVSSYELLYSNTAEHFTAVPLGSSYAPTYVPTDWSKAFEDSNWDNNGTEAVTASDGNFTALSADETLSGPISAQYVLIVFTLKDYASGTGIFNLQIFGSEADDDDDDDVPANIIERITWTDGTNVKTSSEWANKAIYALAPSFTRIDSESPVDNYWTVHSSAYNGTAKSAWLAIDLGEPMNVGGFKLISSSGAYTFSQNVSSYKVLYSTTAASFTGLPAVSTSTDNPRYDHSANSWVEAYDSGATSALTDRYAHTLVGGGSETSLLKDEQTLDEPITAQYIMVFLELSGTNAGLFNLQLFEAEPEAPPAVPANIIERITTWTDGTNVKTNAPTAANVGSNALDSEDHFWMWQNTSYTENGGCAWIALDLGQAYDIGSFSWLSASGSGTFGNCASGYKVLYSNEATAFSSLPTSAETTTYDYAAAGWQVALDDPSLTKVQNVQRDGEGYSRVQSQNTITPVNAQYVMVFFTLKNQSAQNSGIQNLQLFEPGGAPEPPAPDTDDDNIMAVIPRWVDGFNVKTSSLTHGNLGSYTVSQDPEIMNNNSLYWRINSSVFKQYSSGAGSNIMWLAVDLGAERDVSGYSFIMVNNPEYNQGQAQSYDIVYTSSKALWDGLVVGNEALGYDWAAKGWTAMTTAKSFDGISTTKTRGTGGGNGLYDELKLAEEDSVNARYVMMFITLKNPPAQQGMVGLRSFNVYGSTDDALEPIPYEGGYPDEYLMAKGHGLAHIEPVYTGMSKTIGRPALIDVTKSTGKFPVFNISDADSISVSGTLTAPDGSVVYTAPAQDITSTGSVSIPDSVALTAGTYVMELALTKGEVTLYDSYYFTAISSFDTYKSTENTENSNNANVGNVHPDDQDTPYPAVQLVNGELVYTPDYKGNQILDYANVGYKGGGEELPNVPVRVKLTPPEDGGDAYQLIQDAIDEVSALPLVNGFRGTVYLAEGVYNISKPLYVRSSGVVIRGAGAGTASAVVQEGSTYVSQIAGYDFEAGVTKLVSTWKTRPNSTWTPSTSSMNDDSTSPWTLDASNTLINFAGGTTVSQSSPVKVVSQYVGAGSTLLRVADASAFQVGNTVRIDKQPGAEWAKTMWMDRIDGANQWLDSNGNLLPGFKFTMERTIAAVDAATGLLTLEEGLADSLDMRFEVATVTRIGEGGRIYNVGIENVQGLSKFYNMTKPNGSILGTSFSAYTDENHAAVFVGMSNVRDGWMRNFITYHFDTAMMTRSGTRNVTIQDGQVLDPVSLMFAGSRRYSIYYNDSQFMFTQRVHSRYSRHAFVMGSYNCGPNVFYDCTSELVTNASEPHYHWSSAGLYDNVLARIYIQNRWNMGTAHGWSGANYVMYNTTGPFVASQSQLSPLYVIGHSFDNTTNKLGTTLSMDPTTGQTLPDMQFSSNLYTAALNDGKAPQFSAYEYHLNGLVGASESLPDSLYLAQLVERKPDAAAIIAVDTVPAMIDGDDYTGMPELLSVSIDGVPMTDFDVLKTIYTISGSYQDFPRVAVEAADGTTVSILYPDYAEMPVILRATNTESGFSVDYELRFSILSLGSPFPIIRASSEDTANNRYAINLLNTADYPYPLGGNPEPVRHTAGSPSWVRMYLGAEPKQLAGIQMGFIKNAANFRAFLMEFEYSMDGVTWIKAANEDWTMHDTADGQEVVSSKFITLTAAGDSGDGALETFTFDAPVEARYFRVLGYGSYMENGTYDGNNHYFRMWPVFADGSSYVPVSEVTVTGPDTVEVGSSTGFAAAVNTGASIPDVEWSVDDPAIASIDANGVLTAKGTGSVTVTATTIDGALDAQLNRLSSITRFSDSVTVEIAEPQNAEEPDVIPGAFTVVDQDRNTLAGSQSLTVIQWNGRNAQELATTAGALTTASLDLSTLDTAALSALRAGWSMSAADVSALNAFPGASNSLVALDLSLYLSGLPVSLLGGNAMLAVPFTADAIPSNLADGEYSALAVYRDAYGLDKVISVTYVVSAGQITLYAPAAGTILLSVPMPPVNPPVNPPAEEEDKDDEDDKSKDTINLEDWINPFTDVTESDWFYEAAAYMNLLGIIKGTDETTFSPGLTLDRATFVTILYRHAGEPEVSGEVRFTDVSAGAWYADAVSWAIEQAVTIGTGDGSTFSPSASISREAMAVMLYRYAKAAGLDVTVSENASLTAFSDAAQVSDWALEAMLWAVEHGILVGSGNGRLNPGAAATRAEAAVVLTRSLPRFDAKLED